MVQELTITVKGEKTKIVDRELVYDPLLMSKDNPFLIERVKRAYDKAFIEEGEEAPKITVKSTIRWQE